MIGTRSSVTFEPSRQTIEISGFRHPQWQRASATLATLAHCKPHVRLGKLAHVGGEALRTSLADARPFSLARYAQRRHGDRWRNDEGDRSKRAAPADQARRQRAVGVEHPRTTRGPLAQRTIAGLTRAHSKGPRLPVRRPGAF